MPSVLSALTVSYLVVFAGATSNSQSSDPSTDCTDVLNNGVRQCCPETGACQDSSCVVFGFPNSARANCHTSGANPNCPTVYCNWKVPSCALTNDNHCYGTVACVDGTTNCASYGDLCLMDGASANFKICGDPCNNDRQCPSGFFCNRTASACQEVAHSPSPMPARQTPDEFVAAVRPCDGLCPPASQHCTNLYNFAKTDNLEADLPACNTPDAVAAQLSDYGCQRQDPECNTVVCNRFVPPSVVEAMQAVQC